MIKYAVICLIPILIFGASTLTYKEINNHYFGIDEINTRTGGEMGEFWENLLKIDDSTKNNTIWVTSTTLEKAWDAGRLVAAICAAPAVVLGKTKIPAGKKWTCYPDMEGESKPEYLSGYSNKVFVTDGNLVTSRGPGAAEEFSMELVRLLAGEEVYRKVHDSAQMR